MQKMSLKSISFIILATLLFSCVKKNDGPSVDDNILNYDIDEVPVTENYTVGAFYYYFATFNPAIPETPVAGKYNMPLGVVPPAVMTSHIASAATAGLDYFVFSFRSVSRDLNNFRLDSTVIRSFLNANGTANMKFALTYNWNAGTYGLATTTALENDAVKLEQFFQDFIKVAPFLSNTNCMKVNGKTLLYINNAETLYSNNNPAIYTTLRSRLKALGFDLYIVGMQERWSPPARYPFRFKDCVDAIYHQSFSGLIDNWDRFYLLPQMMDQNWKYSKKYFTDNYAVDYVPNISPGYTQKILTPTNTNPVYGRTDSGAVYKKLCNVAKMNASTTTRLILIDSWNDWQLGTQLEPSTASGDLYLNITRAQFKKPQ
ncbi:MAG TPA: glycoside hydrolase family 99-like domain-containing protein [Flavitalea sp.]|nr:glycoside hydrolase family 99-like domain-containing protein [Flavitalea sp.]